MKVFHSPVPYQTLGISDYTVIGWAVSIPEPVILKAYRLKTNLVWKNLIMDQLLLTETTGSVEFDYYKNKVLIYLFVVLINNNKGGPFHG